MNEIIQKGEIVDEEGVFGRYCGLFMLILNFNFNISYYDFESD